MRQIIVPSDTSERQRLPTPLFSMQTIGKILGGIVLVALMILSAIFVFSTQTLNRRVEYSDTSPPIPSDSAAKARGQHLATAIAKCTGCHGADLGGEVMIDGMPFARIVAPNLTSGRGGIAAERTDDDFLRAIRHGIGLHGQALAIMPSKAYWHMGDDDVGALVAYLRSVPAVDREHPATSFGLVGRVLLLKGDLEGMFEARDIDHLARRPAPPAADTTVEYGRYLAEIGACTSCHGPTLSGGAIPGAPPEMKPAANITPEAIGSWTEADFFRALREGMRPNNIPIDTLSMPVPLTRLMTDMETKAVFKYLQSVPPKASGGR
jgi:mono/diheme cytochrome c family protein